MPGSIGGQVAAARPGLTVGYDGLRPVSFALVSAILWGLWWIPIRWLEARGLPGAWGGVAMNAGALAVALAWLWLVSGTSRVTRRALTGAILVGLAVGLYSAAINYGDVVRVVLLFYLAPAWSKLIEWRFFGMRWQGGATLALVACLAGAVLVLGGAPGQGAVTAGDFLALVSGMSWAAGAALIFAGPGSGAAPLSAVTAASATLTALVLALAAGVPLSGSWPALQGAGLGAVYVLPILTMTLWSAQRLAPAALSFLLTAEILSGVLSGVWLLDEPFGPWQALGAAMIVLGALSEVLAARRRPARR